MLKNDGSVGREVDLAKIRRTSILFGRSSCCDVLIERTTVSEVHCELVFKDKKWHLKNHSVTNGTLLNGVEVNFPTPLNNGDVFTISKRDFRFCGHGDNAGSCAPPSYTPPPISDGVLFIEQVFEK